MYRKPFPLKKIFLWFVVTAFGGGLAFIILLALISIRVGFGNANQEGFIIPVLAGIFSIAACLFLFIWVLKITLNIMREKDLFTSC
jgi:uncharacterized membrane protein